MPDIRAQGIFALPPTLDAIKDHEHPNLQTDTISCQRRIDYPLIRPTSEADFTSTPLRIELSMSRFGAYS